MIGRIAIASDDCYVKLIEIPEAVANFFENLRKEYQENAFIVDLNPYNYSNFPKADMEIKVYDSWVE